MTNDPTTQGAAALRSWLVETALPHWLARGTDHAAGGFHEHLHPGAYHCTADFRRLRVAARQTYVCARAHGAGVRGADEGVALGVDFLARHAALPGGGYASRFGLNHAPTDLTLDLYDHAFVLLALAGAAAVMPAAPLRARALDLVRFIDTAFSHPLGGWQESVPRCLPRRQNPHMHLLEALLAAHEAFGDTVFLAHAGTIIELFEQRLFDTASGTLPEFFDDALRPLVEGNKAGFLVEPGHHCEWVWLLHWYGQHAPIDAHYALELMRFVDRFGVHEATGYIIDSALSDGSGRVLSSRLWPQTERLKAEFLRQDTGTARQAAATRALAAWLLPDGLWVERQDASGAPLPGPVPASSLYHLVAAILAVCPAG